MFLVRVGRPIVESRAVLNFQRKRVRSAAYCPVIRIHVRPPPPILDNDHFRTTQYSAVVVESI